MLSLLIKINLNFSKKKLQLYQDVFLKEFDGKPFTFAYSLQTQVLDVFLLLNLLDLIFKSKKTLVLLKVCHGPTRNSSARSLSWLGQEFVRAVREVL